MGNLKYYKIKFNSVNRIALKKLQNKNYAVLVFNSKKKVIERIGFFNLFKKEFSLNIFRLIYWLSQNYLIYGKVLYLLISNFLVQIKKSF